MSDPAGYVTGLPEASGTFTGTVSPEVAESLLDGIPDLFPVDIDIGNHPDPAQLLGMLICTTFTIRTDTQAWTLAVDHTEMTAGTNRVRVWLRRPG